MVRQTTIDTINYVKDLDYNHEIKILLIITFFIYALIMLWLSFKVEINWFWWKIAVVILRVTGFAWITFLPLFWLLLLRGASFEILYNYMLGFYTIFFGFVTLLFITGFAELGLRFMGIDVSPKNIQMTAVFKRWIK
jgi:hypothetical protein